MQIKKSTFYSFIGISAASFISPGSQKDPRRYQELDGLPDARAGHIPEMLVCWSKEPFPAFHNKETGSNYGHYWCYPCFPDYENSRRSREKMNDVET